jgi:hypothetical protein
VSDFFRDATHPVARKRYVCVACGWFIPQGEKHTAQTGVFDGAYFSNRYHDECHDELALVREDEFITGDVPVPERFKAEAEAHYASQRAALAAPSTRADNQTQTKD